jgi:hypothetical protein
VQKLRNFEIAKEDSAKIYEVFDVEKKWCYSDWLHEIPTGKKLGTLRNNYLMVSQESSNLQNSAWFVLFQLTKECIKNWVLVNYSSLLWVLKESHKPCWDSLRLNIINVAIHISGFLLCNALWVVLHSWAAPSNITSGGNPSKDCLLDALDC